MKTYHYKDELNDDFAGTKIKNKPLKDNYKFIKKNPVWLFFSFIFYRLIATPLVFLYNKILFHEKIVGRKKLKPYRKQGYYLYGNHVAAASDAFTPSLAAFPKKAHILVSTDAVSVPVLKTAVEMLGGMPIPDKRSLAKPFMQAMAHHAKRNHVVVIYPEAHIWPYYTDIRPFTDVSFRYPAQYGKPMFTVTRTICKRKHSKRPKFVVYVDGPFFPDENLTQKENQRMLRDKAYQTMKERSKLSNYTVINYVRDDESAQEAALN